MKDTLLILQSPRPADPALERIAAMTGMVACESVGQRALRCALPAPEAALRKRIEAECLATGVDCTFLPAPRRLSDFRLLAMDMDSTLITIECIDEIAAMQGLKPQVAAITEAAMRGELEFRESLTRRVALLRGLEESALQKVYDERLALSSGAEKLLTAAKAAGLKTLLVSGGFTYFTERLKSRLGFDYASANTLAMRDGRLTGTIEGEILDAAGKRATLEQTCAALGISPQQAIVIGDGANDLEMMRPAGLSVAYRAKPVVRAQADVALNFVGLDGILPLFA